MKWEPDVPLMCILCNSYLSSELSPPGPWMRYRPGQVRRIPIFADPKGLRFSTGILGYFSYIME